MPLSLPLRSSTSGACTVVSQPLYYTRETTARTYTYNKFKYKYTRPHMHAISATATCVCNACA